MRRLHKQKSTAPKEHVLENNNDKVKKSIRRCGCETER